MHKLIGLTTCVYCLRLSSTHVINKIIWEFEKLPIKQLQFDEEISIARREKRAANGLHIGFIDLISLS